MNLPFPALLILLTSFSLLHSQDTLKTPVVTITPFTADSLIIRWQSDSLLIPRFKTFQLPAYEPEKTSPSDDFNLDAGQASSSENLSAHGYISRGVQLGSTRGLSLQSGMNLRLEGNLGHGMAVTGVLSDQNSPLQPLGNTQTLSELDKVYIRLESENLSGQIGDIELGQQTNRGLDAFERRTNGLWLKGKHNRWQSYIGGGFSYGTFNRQSIQGQDGKQGPYLLKGQNGENFILVLAGSEQVRLDGELVKRGEDQDYTIDYNSAEINFTNARMINSQNQIVVDFEYAADAFLSDYSFGKQLAAVEAGYGDTTQTWSWRIGGNLIQDDANNPLGGTDVDSLRSILGQVADPSGQIWLSTITADSSGDYLLSVDSILTFVGANGGDHTASFTFVGVGRGAYRKIQDNSGIVYFDTSSTLGAYIPAKAYVAPQKQTMVGYRLNYRGQHLKSWFDGAYSGYNPNVYANDPQSLNQPGFVTGVAYAVPIGDHAIELGYDIENLANGFRTFQPNHPESYYRTWQIRPRVMDHDKYQRVALTLKKDGKMTAASLAIDQFDRNDNRVGLRAITHGLLGESDRSHIKWEDQWLEFSSNRSWQRHQWEGSWRIQKWMLGGLVESESGRQDTTIFSNNNHVTNRVSMGYIWNDESSAHVSFQRRNETLQTQTAHPQLFAIPGKMDWTEYRDDYAMKVTSTGAKWLNGTMSMIYRQLFTATDEPPVARGYFLSNADIKGILMQEKLSYQSSFELNEERIPQFEYYYIPVDTGYGNFSFDPVYGYIPNPGGTWLQQRSYTDQEQRVRSINSHNVMRFNSKLPTHLPELFSRVPVSMWINFNVERKARIDTNWVLQNRMALQTEFQVKPASVWKSVSYDVRLTQNDNNLNFYGSEISKTQNHTFGMKWVTAYEPVNTELSFSNQVRQLSYNSIQDEDWKRIGVMVEYPWEFSREQVVTTHVNYQNADQDFANSRDELWKLALSHEWRILRRGRIDQTVEYGTIKSDQANLPYALFDGQQPGENWEYRINGSYRFSNAFQLQSNYSIRKRGARGTEQFFRMEGRAYF